MPKPAPSGHISHSRQWLAVRRQEPDDTWTYWVRYGTECRGPYVDEREALAAAVLLNEGGHDALS